MGVWAINFDMLIFVYAMKLNVIVIGKYMNGFHANNMCYCLSLLGFSNIIPDKPAILVYHHQFCSPLETVYNSNHFAYLKPISATTDVLVND